MIKKVKISSIIIPKKFKNNKPSEMKIEKCRKYYRENGQTDKRLIINKKKVLLDNYIRYLILLENGVTEVEVEIINTNKYSPNVTYVYGVHPSKDKEYVWKIPYKAKFLDKVVPGCEVLVKTKNGRRKIYVTRVETLDIPPNDLLIKNVVRYIDNSLVNS